MTGRRAIAMLGLLLVGAAVLICASPTRSFAGEYIGCGPPYPYSIDHPGCDDRPAICAANSGGKLAAVLTVSPGSGTVTAYDVLRIDELLKPGYLLADAATPAGASEPVHVGDEVTITSGELTILAYYYFQPESRVIAAWSPVGKEWEIAGAVDSSGMVRALTSCPRPYSLGMEMRDVYVVGKALSGPAVACISALGLPNCPQGGTASESSTAEHSNDSHGGCTAMPLAPARWPVTLWLLLAASVAAMRRARLGKFHSGVPNCESKATGRPLCGGLPEGLHAIAHASAPIQGTRSSGRISPR